MPPDGHAAQVAAPALDAKKLSAHAAHAAAVVAPEAADEVPAGQGVHAVLPEALAYVPGWHREQVDAPAAE